MKPRHAAALALVGWYLLAPPFAAPYTPDPTAPLSQWDHEESFDSATKCEDYAADLLKTAKAKAFAARDSTNPFKAAAFQGFADAQALAQCISTDDPRLKGN